MGMVAAQQRFASAFVVCFGPFGAVSQRARDRGVSRQTIYREAAWVETRVDGSAWQEQIERLRRENGQLQQRLAQLQHHLEQAVILDRDKQEEFATVGQAIGVSLSDARTLLDVLLPGQIASVAQLGRCTQAAGRRAGELLEVLDEWARPLVRQAVADEIYVSPPVLMLVEPDSLCWVAGHLLNEPVTGAAWTREFAQLPALEQVARDGGNCLGRGLADLNRQRHEKDLPAVADQLDHFHLLREGGRVVGRAERLARQAFRALQAAEADWAERRRQGKSLAGWHSHWRACLTKAERAMDRWSQQERAWQQIQAALRPFTPAGELNTRAHAEAVLTEILPQLPDPAFASFKRQVQRPEALTYLDEIQRKLAAWPAPTEVRNAAVRQEGIRRRPELLQGETTEAAAMRGVFLTCAVILAQAGEMGQRTVDAVRTLLRSSWRASSLVECVNSVVRMQQARHRKMSQGLLNLKRLYWNSHSFRTGRRRGQSPYQRLGILWPEGVRWWDVLKWSPEQLRCKLSAPPTAA
jgi:hypothetical protein